MARHRRRRAAALDAEVIVIGAGLAGLSAALTLHDAGAKVLVLEARDRVGGKTWSRQLAGGAVDMGAAWINDTNQSKMYSLVRRFGLKTIVQNTKGDILMQDLDGSIHRFPYGSTPVKEIEPGGVANMVKIRDTFESICQKVDLSNPIRWSKEFAVDFDEMSMEDFCRHYGGGETALRTVTVWTKAMLGLEAREVSSLYFLAYCKSGGGIMRMRSDERDGGQFWRLAEGTQSFSRKIVETLAPENVHLNTPVVSIDATPTTVTVITSKRTFTAKHVILAIPSVLYKTLMFSPPLPPLKEKLVNGTIHGHLSKVFVAYKEPWWRNYGFCGLTQSLSGLIAVTRDTSNDSVGQYTLLGFIAADAGRRWSKLPPELRREAVFGHFRSLWSSIISVGEIAEPTDYIEQMWWEEPYSQGCPCPAMPPKLMTELAKETNQDATSILSEKHGNVHFAGTEMARVWRGYMEGAVRSGEDAAREVLPDLRFGAEGSKL